MTVPTMADNGGSAALLAFILGGMTMVVLVVAAVMVSGRAPAVMAWSTTMDASAAQPQQPVAFRPST